MEKRALTVALAFFVISVLIVAGCQRGGNGPDRPVACYNDADCPPLYNRFCNENGSVCLSSIIFRCEAPGTSDSSCVEGGGGLGCYACPNGCVNGSCLPGNFTPDLVVREFIHNVVDNQSDVRLNLTVSVMNVGTGLAGQSTTQLAMGTTVLVQYPTPQLAPQQSVTLQPPATIVLLRGTTSTVTATADAQNQVSESREDNNQLTRQLP